MSSQLFFQDFHKEKRYTDHCKAQPAIFGRNSIWVKTIDFGDQTPRCALKRRRQQPIWLGYERVLTLRMGESPQKKCVL